MSLARWQAAGILEREAAIYRSLARKIGNITFVSYGDKQDEELAAGWGGIDVFCNRVGWPGRIHYWRAGRFQPRGTEPLIYKSNQLSGAELGLAAARRAGAPFIARCGFLYSLNTERAMGKDSPQARQARRLEQMVFQGADRVVLTTPAMAAEAIRRHDLDQAKVRVIPNYVLTEEFKAERTERPQGRPRLIFVGRLSPEKNLVSLIEAVAGLDVELTLVGDGPLRAELAARAEDKGLAAHFTGPQPHLKLPELFKRATAFVLPSLYEGHPKSLLEAMSTGLPVIGADSPGIREVIDHRRTGLLTPPTVKGLRAAITALIEDQTLADRLGQAAAEYIRAECSLERVIELELGVIAELASRAA